MPEVRLSPLLIFLLNVVALCRVALVVSGSETLRTIACQAPLSLGFSRQEYWSGLPCPPPGDLPDPGTEPRSPALQADSLPAELPGKPHGGPAAAAKLLQSCPTQWDPIDSSPPGSPVPGILQARTLEWVAISFSKAGKWKVKVKSLSRVRLSATPWTAPHQVALSSVQFSLSVVSDSLRSHESQHTRPPCPSPTPWVHSNSCPSSQWCHPDISSSVVPFSSCPQPLPASESFPMSQLFAWGG